MRKRLFILAACLLACGCQAKPWVQDIGTLLRHDQPEQTAAKASSGAEKAPAPPAPEKAPAPPASEKAPAPPASTVCRDEALAASDFSETSPRWDKIWAACPGSPVAGYNNAVSLLRAGKVQEAARAVSEAFARHPGFQPLQDLSQRLNAPFALVGKLADAKLKTWLASESRHSFTRTPPQKATPPPLPKLVKDEFEKKADFEARVDRARKDREAQLRRIEKDYAAAVAGFNAAVDAHNKKVRAERAERMAQLPAMRARYLQEAMSDVFGDPGVVDPVYDSEAERFHARLVSSSGLLDQKVTISVPLDQGREFKDRFAQAKVVVPYTVQENRLVRGAARVILGSRTYEAMFTDEVFAPVAMTAVADASVAQGETISPMAAAALDMSSVLKEEQAYFGEALNTQDDPRLAALRQEQAENTRKLREAQQQQALEAERQRIEAQIKRQEQQLAALGGEAGKEYEGLREKRAWTFAPAKKPARDMVAVVIGNRSYGKGIPLVPYAHNDAKAVRAFLTAGLGVPRENILFREDATKGEMESLFRRTLPNRVKARQTDVLVYFSGHGMPVDDAALLLPSDARPDTADITGYSRDTMLAQLASLNAASVTVILDACFSGTAKGGEALVRGKPVFKQPGSVRLPGDTVFIAASRANQISRMDDKAGMSLMTLYLLEGLSGKADKDGDHAVSVAELRGYLENEVDRAARISFDMGQQPEVLGPATRTLVAY
ncbi:MAG: caspase family protein [Desulfovibrionaceae bacterium]